MTRILLVEDELINRKFTLSILDKLNYRADAVADGAEAIKKLKHTHYDLVLMDIHLPGMDGYELTRLIRDSDSFVRNKNVPIVALTARWGRGDRERCLEKGMDDFISKPIEPNRLSKVIGRQLSKSIRNGRKTSDAYEETDSNAIPDGSDNDIQLFKKLIKIYLQKLPLQIRDLKQALKENNPAMVQELGHTIKGGSALIEAKTLRDYAFEIEKAGKSHDMKLARELVSRLEDEYIRFSTDTSS